MDAFGAFKGYAGYPTGARLVSQRDLVGVYDPTKPVTPLYGPAGTTRYGFTEFFNSYRFGPEGTSVAALQEAVNAGKVPRVAPGTPVGELDRADALYILVGSVTLYELYVAPRRPVVDLPPVQPPAPPPVLPPAPPPPAGLSTPEQRVDELFYGFVVHEVYPAVRPVLISILKMVRKAAGKS